MSEQQAGQVARGCEPIGYDGFAEALLAGGVSMAGTF